jgi:hypothetical protein
MLYLVNFRHLSVRLSLLSCREKYPTRILLICLAAALALATGACEGGDGDGTGPVALSEDEKYLIDAYVDVKSARSDYPHNPIEAESLFTVLDSTIDTVRIANTIRAVNTTPERWLLILEEIEKQLRAQGKISGQEQVKPDSRGSKQSGG